MTGFFARSRVSKLLPFVTTLALVSMFVVTSGWFATTARTAKATTQTAATSTHPHIDCANEDFNLCTDTAQSKKIFGHYVGHDEPANLFYSDEPGSGNRARYELTLPSDPSPANPDTPGKSFNFELHPAFWFSMVMCDTQSDPNQTSTCTPDSDSNIVNAAFSPVHAGSAFEEMQFYPPGWVLNGQGASGTSCSATQWCAALNIDSLSDNPVTGQNNNAACAAAAGIEYVNFAIITKDGVPQGPVSPLLSTLETFRANPQKALFMNSGDQIQVTMQDTAHGLRIDLKDETTHTSGFMVASAANGFAQVKFDPTGTNCDVATHNLPFDFHPMYSTSSEQTSATWTAHTMNIGFSDEIGHFQICSGPNAITPGGTCPKGDFEGTGANQTPSDGDDTACFPASSSTLVQIGGCFGENDGNDGVSYLPDWPDGNTAMHPTSLLFTSPLTGEHFDRGYPRSAFETDLALLEFEITGQCNVFTGVGCVLIPLNDLGVTASFYPFYSTRQRDGHCVWQLGSHIPGSTNDFGQLAEWGVPTQSTFTAFNGGGLAISAFINFRQVLSTNPCRADHN
jgi:hypothetical protein